LFASKQELRETQKAPFRYFPHSEKRIPKLQSLDDEEFCYKRDFGDEIKPSTCSEPKYFTQEQIVENPYFVSKKNHL